MARPPASVGVLLEEVALRGVREICPRIKVVASRLVGEDGIESAGGRWPIETVGLVAKLVAKLLGSKGSTS